jgi:hypothetical protein
METLQKIESRDHDVLDNQSRKDYSNAPQMKYNELKEGKGSEIIDNRETHYPLRKQEYSSYYNEKTTLQKTDELIDNFSDKNPKVRDLISMAVKDFSSNNPREIKRFVNTFRFHYFLRAARESLGLSIPSLEQFTFWIILSFKWPQLIRWLEWSPAWAEYGKRPRSVSTYL